MRIGTDKSGGSNILNLLDENANKNTISTFLYNKIENYDNQRNDMFVNKMEKSFILKIPLL